MQKSAQAFRTISEVASDLDIPQHVLRFWESKFAQVKPMKRGGGRRYYRPEDVELLRGIRTLLYDDGFTIKGVQKVFRDRGVRFVMDSGKPNGERPVLMGEAGPMKPSSYVEDVPSAEGAPTEGSANGLVGEAGPAPAPVSVIHKSLSEDQKRKLNNVLSELLELKSLIQAARGAETLNRANSR